MIHTIPPLDSPDPGLERVAIRTAASSIRCQRALFIIYSPDAIAL
jgi:hypothetical protein